MQQLNRPPPPTGMTGGSWSAGMALTAVEKRSAASTKLIGLPHPPSFGFTPPLSGFIPASSICAVAIAALFSRCSTTRSHSAAAAVVRSVGAASGSGCSAGALRAGGVVANAPARAARAARAAAACAAGADYLSTVLYRCSSDTGVSPRYCIVSLSDLEGPASGMASGSSGGG